PADGQRDATRVQQTLTARLSDEPRSAVFALVHDRSRHRGCDRGRNEPDRLGGLHRDRVNPDLTEALEVLEDEELDPVADQVDDLDKPHRECQTYDRMSVPIEESRGRHR